MEITHTEAEVQRPLPVRDYTNPPPAAVLDVHECKLWSFYRALVAEFVATLLLLYVGVATILGNAGLNATTYCGGVGVLGTAWAFGGMIFILVYCTAGISGGHLNPAVTLGMFLARKVSLARTLLYIVVQCLGAIAGTGIARALQSSYNDRIWNIPNSVQQGYSQGVAFAAEIVGTFVLVYTVFSANDSKRRARDCHIPVLAPLPIGFAVFVVHLTTIPITGTGINPARSFGTAVIYAHRTNWHEQWIFWLGPFTGAALAAGYHEHVLRAGAARALQGTFPSTASSASV